MKRDHGEAAGGDDDAADDADAERARRRMRHTPFGEAAFCAWKWQNVVPQECPLLHPRRAPRRLAAAKARHALDAAAAHRRSREELALQAAAKARVALAALQQRGTHAAAHQQPRTAQTRHKSAPPAATAPAAASAASAAAEEAPARVFDMFTDDVRPLAVDTKPREATPPPNPEATPVAVDPPAPPPAVAFRRAVPFAVAVVPAAIVATAVVAVAAVAAAAAPGVGGSTVGDDGSFAAASGAVLAGRYRVEATLGRGVFATVLRCLDLHALAVNAADATRGAPKLVQVVALKVCRADAARSARAAADREIAALRAIDLHFSKHAYDSSALQARQHIAKLVDALDVGRHRALVMEVLHHDLRRVAKKHKSSTTPQPFGLGGLPLETMQLYTGQLFHALKHVHAAGLVHLDVKPDNVVLDAARGRCVLCDFGSAAFVHDLQRAHKKAPSAYVQSRFYRAPEVPLGVGPLTGRADVWALGVTLAEVATGRLMLTGRDNHALLRATVSALGPPPSGLVDRGRHSDKHFIAVHPAAGATGYALRRRPGSSEHDSATKAPARPLSLVLAYREDDGRRPRDGDSRIAAQFLELIERTLSWDPDRRISADDALKFAFVRPAPAP